MLDEPDVARCCAAPPGPPGPARGSDYPFEKPRIPARSTMRKSTKSLIFPDVNVWLAISHCNMSIIVSAINWLRRLIRTRFSFSQTYAARIFACSQPSPSFRRKLLPRRRLGGLRQVARRPRSHIGRRTSRNGGEDPAAHFDGTPFRQKLGRCLSGRVRHEPRT